VCDVAAAWALNPPPVQLFARKCPPLFANATDAFATGVLASTTFPSERVNVTCGGAGRVILRHDRLASLHGDLARDAGDTGLVLPGTLCVATCTCPAACLLLGPPAFMCDIDGVWRAAATWWQLGGGRDSSVPATQTVGQAAHLSATDAGAGAGAAGAANATWSVDCTATRVAHVAPLTPPASPATRCIASALQPPELRAATACGATSQLAVTWAGVPSFPWAAVVQAEPPFSRHPYALAQQQRAAALAAQPAGAYRLFVVAATPDATAAAAAAPVIRAGLDTACRHANGTPAWASARVLLFGAAASHGWPQSLSLPPSVSRPLGAADAIVTPLLGVEVAAWEEGRRAGTLTPVAQVAVQWNASATLLASVSRAVAAAAGANAAALHALTAALRDAAVYAVLTADDSALAPAQTPPAEMVGGCTVVRAFNDTPAGVAVASSPLLVAADVGSVLLPSASALTATTIDAIPLAPQSTCSTITATLADGVMGGQAAARLRRAVIGDLLPNATLTVAFSAPPAEDEVLTMRCAASGPAAPALRVALPASAMSQQLYAVRRSLDVTISVVSARLRTVAAGRGMLAGSITCNVTSSSASSYANATQVTLDVVALAAVWPFFSDAVVQTRAGGLRSAWSSAPIPIASLVRQAAAARRLQGGGGGNDSVASLASLPREVANSLLLAVSRRPLAAAFALTLPGATNLTLVADEWQRGVPSRFLPGTNVTVNGVPAAVQGISADGRLLTFTTPSFAEVCPGGSARCQRASIAITPPVTLRPADLVELSLGTGRAQAIETDLQTGARRLSLPISCPPFCPGITGVLPYQVRMLAAVEDAQAGLPAPVQASFGRGMVAALASCRLLPSHRRWGIGCGSWRRCRQRTRATW
jgi:hypothetical protein